MQLFQSSKSSARNKSLSSSTSVHKINDNIALKKKKHYPSPAVPEQYKVETHLCADTSPRMRKARPRRIMILQTMIQNVICNNNYVQFYPNMVWLPRYHTLIILCCSNARLDVQIFARGRLCTSVNIWRKSWVENYPIFNIKFLSVGYDWGQKKQLPIMKSIFMKDMVLM